MKNYRATEAARHAGVSYRKLDYWARRGLVSPSIMEANGCGTQRSYTARDITVMYAIGRLSELGLLTLTPNRLPELVAKHVREHGLTGIVTMDCVTVDLDVLANGWEPPS